MYSLELKGCGRRSLQDAAQGSSWSGWVIFQTGTQEGEQFGVGGSVRALEFRGRLGAYMYIISAEVGTEQCGDEITPRT